jgi:RNA polymerase sigma-70 factor (ECF subfamily)
MWNASAEALFAGYATGDPQAAAVFIRRFQGKAYGLALLITRDPMEAEDVVQTAFVRAWRYASSYDPRRGSVSSWLLRIVRNVAIDRVQMAEHRAEMPTPDFPAELLTDPDDVADLVGQHDGAQHIREMIHELPREQSEALLAVTLGGMSAREYSEATETPLGTVKTRIRLALHKLRDELGVRVA